MKISLDTKTMHPWHDINRMLSNAKSLTVKAGGRTYDGAATLEDDNGNLTLVFPPRRLVKTATKPGTVSRAKVRKAVKKAKK